MHEQKQAPRIPLPTLEQRSIASLSWNLTSSLLLVIVGVVRSILLARLLPVEAFGVYGWAGSVVLLSGVVANFGLPNAFIHRTTETQNETLAANSYFTLRLILSSVWFALLGGYALIYTTDNTRIALLVLGATTLLGSHLTQPPRYILVRRVMHRRIALLQILDTLLISVGALYLAWRGAGLWALLITDVISCALNIWLFYFWKPVWRPRLDWNKRHFQYYLSFGHKQLLVDLLLSALDRVDDFWTGLALGDLAMGYYSKAYTFATYPRKIIAAPVNQVALGAYAELKSDRLRLSQAFFRFNALLVRSGFLLAGLLALIAPEFIRLLLTDKWMPMLDAFRLMLVYTLFDPLKMTISAVFVAMGRPERVARVHALQLLILIVGLMVLGPYFNIAGVALAVNLMLIVGIGVLLWQVRDYVDFSLSKLFGIPLLGLVLGMVLTYLALQWPGVVGSDWRTGAVKLVVFTLVYGGVLALLERRNLLLLWAMLRRQLFKV